MEKKLYRSSTDRWFFGVCGGLGAYLGLDPTLVRLLFVLLAFAGGGGVLIYLILAIIMRQAPEGMDLNQSSESLNNNPQAAVILGGALVLIGGAFILRNLGIHAFNWVHWQSLWPVALILIGGVLLFQYFRSEK